MAYIFNYRGIEANPDKIKALLDMRLPRRVKEVQSLNGRVAALSRFVARATDKCHPFFQALKRRNDVEWGEDCERAFQELKTYMGQPPLLAKPKEKENLYIYLVVSEHSVSVVLVREEEKPQWPVYYVMKALFDLETRYTEIETLTLALVTAVKKLRPYFQAHKIVVLTSYQMRKVLKNTGTRRIAIWGKQTKGI